MSNVLNTLPDYQITRTARGVWRRYFHESGPMYKEFTSHTKIGGWPLVSVAYGRSPETGKQGTARGVVAVGRKAVGLVAVGQAALGVLAIGQAATGVIAIGQAATGVIAVGQVALGLLIGVGQVATGMFTVGQFVVGREGWAQAGFGPQSLHTEHRWHS